MEFNKYNSINNATKKNVDKIKTEFNTKQKFVVLEKIHGTNFGVHLDTDTMEVKFSKRTGFITEDDNFFNYKNVTANLTRNIKLLQSVLKAKNNVVSVYGELFGGGFFGKQEEGCVKIQREVEYHPSTKFMAYDVFVNGEPIYWAKAERLLNDGGFDIVPIIAVANSLDEAFEVSNTFNTHVPLYYGILQPNDKPNTAEGTIIKPYNTEGVMRTGKRIILKNKNSKFSEKKSKVRTKKEEAGLTESSNEIYNDVSQFITENKISNVISKIGQVTSKDFGKVTGMFIKDIIEDYESEIDETANLKKLIGDEWPTFNKKLKKDAQSLLREVWSDYLEEL